MADSQGRTGEQIIKSIGKDVILELYGNKDIARDLDEATRRLQDPETNNKDFVSLLRLIWDFRIAKPKQAIGIESDMPIQINISEGITNGKEH